MAKRKITYTENLILNRQELTEKLEERTLRMRTLNTIENAILNYGRAHKAFVNNPYQYFSEVLGYKRKNYLYEWFGLRDTAKIGLDDIKKIVEVTKDKDIIKAVLTELEEALER